MRSALHNPLSHISRVVPAERERGVADERGAAIRAFGVAAYVVDLGR